MNVREAIKSLPLLRQLGGDRLALGRAAQSRRSATLVPRTATADRVVQSICPYCAVGCGQKVYVQNEQVVQIEGDQDSPVSRGRLCPKGSASEQYVNSPLREYKVKYRRPHSSDWEDLDLERATDMIADRVIAARAATWEHETEEGEPLSARLAAESNMTLVGFLRPGGFNVYAGRERIDGV